MLNKAVIGALMFGLSVGLPAMADSDYDFARVTHVEPNYRQVRISVPRRECYSESSYEHSGERPAAGGMIMGGLIGAVIGHQFGHGHESGLGTVAGAVIGSAIGHDASQRHGGDRYPRSTDYPQSTERCETHYSESTEQRIDGYHVSYRYNDRNFETDLPYDPGERLRVRVTVTPDGY